MNFAAVLFDLDNTLILFRESIFFKEYSTKLGNYFSDILSFQEFSHRLMHSTQKLIDNDGGQSNLDFFMRSFTDGLNHGEDELYARFRTFYTAEFAQFKYLMTPLKCARDIMIDIREKGSKLVIASNPMFPMNVQMMRLEWTNVSDLPFDLITSVENSTFCKPRVEYYQEICDKIEVRPDACLMVGNDPFNDMIASRIGMTTYLTTDSDEVSIELSRALAQKVHMELPEPDFKGSLKDLMQIMDFD